MIPLNADLYATLDVARRRFCPECIYRRSRAVGPGSLPKEYPTWYVCRLWAGKAKVYV